MSMAVTFLTLLSHFLYGVNTFRTCIPNTQFLLNGRVCFCDHLGRWSEPDCKIVNRRQTCQAGQIIWQGCSQCICQESGQLLCTNARCPEDSSTQSMIALRVGLNTVSPWCTPFRSYYVDCNICVCPASGKTSEARCNTDASCTQQKPPTSDFLVSINKNVCLPKVMYLFPCLHCLCTDEGFFVLDKCIETCQRHQTAEPTRRCIPRTFYRKDCNVCLCPDDSFPDHKVCTKVDCNESSPFRYLRTVKSVSEKCEAHRFTKSRCLYCDCNSEGTINENACLELDCLKADNIDYNIARETCSPGEMVPICIECFCLRNDSVIEKYCSRACSYQNKLNILERVIKDNSKNHKLIDRDLIKSISGIDNCVSNSIYLDQGRYCLCPENGNTNFKLCTSITEDFEGPNSYNLKPMDNSVRIDFNVTCEPSTFVTFECNSCFCSKSGTIDPKWCTYDDCAAKKIIQESLKSSVLPKTVNESNGTCVPGSISKVDCNFCICSESGLLKDRACTKNRCLDNDKSTTDDKFNCEPLAYYEVDCNICFCPRDGFKNVAKCTKNLCERGFLRSDVCVPGHLFSDECNVCVCPPNGVKADKACTNHTCPDAAAAWKKIFKLSQSLLGNQVTEDTTRSLDLCFPGEEFFVGCKLCVCPDMGLRTYATCTPIVCDEEQNNDRENHAVSERIQEHRISRRDDEACLIYNITNSAERQDCTPGSMYIIRCRQCICPYMGSINNFCRPLPAGTYCEQAYPGFNYLPMGRRQDEVMSKRTLKPGNATAFVTSKPGEIKISHKHTKYRCESPGKVMDKCFICDCENNFLIEEHCFRSDADNCTDVKPTFLSEEYKVVLG